MRNFLALVGAAVVVVIGLGYYLGWYRIEAEQSRPGQRRFDVEVNTDKISRDLKKGKDKLSQVLSSDDKDAPRTERPVEGQPTGYRGGLNVNEDGSITYKGDITLPPLVPGNSSR